MKYLIHQGSNVDAFEDTNEDFGGKALQFAMSWWCHITDLFLADGENIWLEVINEEAKE